MAEKLLIRQTYTSSFILNESKLNRLNEIIFRRLSTICEEENIAIKITVYLEKSKTIYLTTFDELFQQDNSLKNKIRSMSIIYYAHKEKGYSGREVITLKFNDYREDNIEYEVNYEDSTWSKDTSAEIDEQIERIMSNSLYNKISSKNLSSSVFSSIFTIIFGVVVVGTFLSTIFKSKPILLSSNEIISKNYNNAITPQEVDTLQKLLLQNNSLEDKINFLYKKDSIMLTPKIHFENSQPVRSSLDLNFLTDYHFYIICLPIILIIGLCYYLFKYCYPKYVFEWGDYAIYYQKLIERRKIIWNLLLGSIFLGLLINLFSFGITDLFSKK